jgi:CDP-diglyceride synthetase
VEGAKVAFSLLLCFLSIRRPLFFVLRNLIENTHIPVVDSYLFNPTIYKEKGLFALINEAAGYMALLLSRLNNVVVVLSTHYAFWAAQSWAAFLGKSTGKKKHSPMKKNAR